jgi:hypothetical protein
MGDEKSSEEYGAEGGKKRAERLTKAQLSEIGRKGAVARWAKTVPMAKYGSTDRPLRLGELEIPCYVLDDGRRVLIQRGMFTALDMKQGTASKGGGDRLSKFIGTKALSGFVTPELAAMITKPVVFSVNGTLAYGYEATILADVCDAVLAARKAGKLNYQQEHIAEQCEILVRGFARVGIVALVDEATGYQADRARDALAKLLEAYVQKELKPWVRTFPAEYYKHLCRLKGIAYPPENMRLPQWFGRITNNIIYQRLAPGVLEELKKNTPRDEQGRHKHKLFQRLTDEVGHPKLREHLAAVVALLSVARTYGEFEAHLEIVKPKWSAQMRLFEDSVKALPARLTTSAAAAP